MADKKVVNKKALVPFQENVRGKIFWKVKEDECEAIGITPERAFADWKECHDVIAPNDQTQYILSLPLPRVA